MATTTLGLDEQGKERQRAFDLLDALTKSGALSVDMASLHVVIAATHCFDKTLMNTLIQVLPQLRSLPLMPFLSVSYLIQLGQQEPD